MTPEQKAELARINGAKSRGPITPEGKAASSMNALRHGLTAETVVLLNESQESFSGLLKEYMEEIEPVGRAECDLVHRMVVSIWRERRAWTLETASLNRELVNLPETEDESAPAARLAAAFRSLTDNSRSLERLYVHEEFITRRFERAHRRLLELQERREVIAPRKIVVQWVDSTTDKNGPKTAPDQQNNKTNRPPEARLDLLKGGETTNEQRRTTNFPSRLL